MVYRVCRRVLRHEQDTEDAFQATFLVLGKKVRSLRNQSSLAAWLHSVAHRVALKAKAQAATRRHHERSAPPPPDGPADEITLREFRAVFDAELARLPEKWRLPLVLCYLESRTQEEAASQLGWSKNTLRRRLEEARAALGRRLRKRGVSPAALSAVLLSDCVASAAMPPQLVGPAVAAGAGATAAPVVSAKVVALSEGVLKAMFLTKVKIATALLLSLAALVTGAGVMQRPVLAVEPSGIPTTGGPAVAPTPAAQPPRQAARQAAPPGPNRLLFYRAGYLTLIGPDGKDAKKIPHNRDKWVPGLLARLSPDGKRIAYLKPVEEDLEAMRKWGTQYKAYVSGVDELEPGTLLGVMAQTLSWSPDGKSLVVGDMVRADNPEDIKFVNWLVDVKTRKKTELKLPSNHQVTDWSSDGKYFLTTAFDFKKRTTRLHLVSRDGSDDRALTGAGAHDGQLSPDGGKVLYIGPDPERKGKEPRAGLFVLDIRSGKVTRVQDQPLNGERFGHCWSPDGKRIAHAWRMHKEGDGTPANLANPTQITESFLIVSDMNGRNPVTIATERGSPGAITIANPDWR
jgi:RNA polymerase sigma factor (sigma-70 family)